MYKIGVIDSGVGGLTVLFELKKRIPNADYIYVGDSLNCPYGTKSNDEIKMLAYRLVKYIIEEKKIDMLVIACNSISSVALSYLKDNFNIPIVEVINPTIEVAKEKSLNKKIGIIGTNATIASGAYNKGFVGYEVFSKACPIFVDVVENMDDYSESIIDNIVKNELQQIISNNIDTLILGCTHFPILINSIKKVFNGNIITSSEAVARKIENIVGKSDYIGKMEIYTTKDEQEFKNKITSIFNEKYDNIYKINI